MAVRSVLRSMLLLVFMILFLVLSASALCPETKLEVLPSDVTIDTPGTLEPGMAVVMSVRVSFPDKENTTYPETHQLELTSGLDTPGWTWTIVRNSIRKDEIEERNTRVIIKGGILSWPANVTESLHIHLYGTAPSVMEPKRVTVLRILDVAGTSCNDPVYQYSAYVLNTTRTRERIASLADQLSELRADAVEKRQSVSGNSPVLEKIEEARRNLDKANTTPAFEFVSIELALNQTEAAIADGRRLLEDVPVAGTAVSRPVSTVQQTLPYATSPTPASADPAPLLTGIVACAGAVAALRRGRR